MSALLDIVAEARDLKRDAEVAFHRAIRRAYEEGGHTGLAIAKAAGLSKQRVSQILRGERK